MSFTFPSIFIIAVLIGLGAMVQRAVRAAQQRVSPVKLLVRVDQSRHQQGRKYE